MTTWTKLYLLLHINKEIKFYWKKIK